MFVENPALYIHIPFCVSKCTYCDFFSVPQVSVPDSYVSALIKELKHKIEIHKIKSFYSVYFGGGTPSLLSKSQISSLLENILPFTTDKTEISFECNCDDISFEFLEFLNEVGITRLSVGVQSFNEKTLSCIKRRANRQESLNAIKVISEFTEKYPQKKLSFSLDFISGLPFSTNENLIEDLQIAVENKIPHISLYSLTLEEKTPLYKQIASGKIDFDENLANDQWILGRDFLLQNGYKEYEISNFAISGFESKHNSFYWQEKDYIGIGSGAVETIFSEDGKSGVRKTNLLNIEEYIKTTPNHSFESEEIDFETVYFEYLMTGFRTSKGVNSTEFFNRFGIKLEEVLQDKFTKYVEQNKAIISNENYYFLPDGMLFLNQFLVDIL